MIVEFPADRRLADVRRCAAKLMHLHGESANEYWRAEMKELVARLRRSGQSEEEIARQAAAFMAAVQMELQILFAELPAADGDAA
ncbi:DUF6074 family protein [Rhizobium sp. BK251]|uniref:DUF6074 family protein n=1 Tax=Rhizobium sp. BK251 TaxID=2512125 RepID=UPI0010D62640|nr:hypothetical protein EV286_103540 [Rhizobium sp. BK251]